MKLELLKNFLNERLKGQMPGESAHDLMKPRLPNGDHIRFKYPNSPRTGGVLILFYEENGLVRFPLIQRPVYDGIHSGQIALPGGRKEEEDKDLIVTALREAEEEIGIDRSKVEVMGSLTPFYVGASNYDVLPVVGFLHEKPLFVPDPREVSSIITPPASRLLDESAKKTKEITVQNGYKLTSPYFDLEDKVVWGATAMMLSELMVLLQEY